MIFVTADRNLAYADLTARSKEAYCEEHGYAFLRVAIPEDENPYWYLVEAMKQGLQGDWMNFTGADSYIVPGSGPCEHLLDEDYDLIISKDVNGLNNNGFFLKNSEWGRAFLEKVWALKSDEKIPVPDTGDGLVIGQHEWFEQAAFVLVLREIGTERVKFVPKQEINAYPWDREQGNFIIHLPGKSDTERSMYFRDLFGGITTEQKRRLAWLERKEKNGLDESERIALEALRCLV